MLRRHSPRDSMKPVSWSRIAMSASQGIAATVLLLGTFTAGRSASDPTELELERRFPSTVRPFLDSYCTACHGGEKPMAQLDLRAYSNMAAVVHDFGHWTLVLEK